MDQVLHYQELQTLNLFIKYKKALQFILSLSIFSLLISYYSWFSSLFLHSMNLYFNNFPFHLVDCALDRKYLFLLCNGIIVFLSTNSGLIGSRSSKTHQNDMSEVNYVEVEVQHVEEIKTEEVLKEEEKEENVMITKEEEEAQEGEEKGEEEEEQQEEKEENGTLIKYEEFEEEEEGEEEGEEENGSLMDEQGDGMLNTEELNKKFDEFIRKMKEEIRVEAQQLAVIV